MKTRIISASIIIALLIGILSLGKIPVFISLVVIDALCLYEYTKLVDNGSKKIILMILMGTAMLLIAWFNVYYTFAIMPVIFVIIFGYNMYIKNYDLNNILLNIWGILYIPFFLSLFTGILKANDWIFYTIITFVACYSSDTFAYFTGVTIGKHKLCPEISPKKSIEGFWGGLLGSVILTILTGIIFAKFFNFNIPIYHYIILSIIISIAGLIGDLTASMVKRKFNVKDYSNLIPGHGGMLDRVDSLMFTLAVMYFYMNVILGVI